MFFILFILLLLCSLKNDKYNNKYKHIIWNVIRKFVLLNKIIIWQQIKNTYINNYNKIGIIRKRPRENKHFFLYHQRRRISYLAIFIIRERRIIATSITLIVSVIRFHEYASRNKNYLCLSEVSSNTKNSTFLNTIEYDGVSSFFDGQYVDRLVYESDMAFLLE